jgi:DNA-binding transcriptional ArsR family regulator
MMRTARKAAKKGTGKAGGGTRRTLRDAAVGPGDASERQERDAVFAVVARYFALLADSTRLRILHAICNAEQSVSAIVETTGAGQTNVSRHLALLHQAGVVARRKEGSAVFYRVSDPEIVSICRTVCVQIAGRLDERRPLRDELLDFAARH